MDYLFSLTFDAVFVLFLNIIIIALVIYLYHLKKILTLGAKRRAYLENIIKDLDHQTKLIIKSDIELKLYQDAVNDKLKKLSFLKHFISSSLNILDRESLFSQITKGVVQSIGFENAAIITCEGLEVKINQGFSEGEIDALKKFITKHREVFTRSALITPDSEICGELKRAFSFQEFLMCPIVLGSEIYAVFCLYKCIVPEGMTEDEREVFSIIAMYLGQCLDNIKLFEALYRSGEELEGKVKQKTFELTKTLQEIEKISKMKSDFISSVSHELRTPLTSIKGYSSLLVAEKFGALTPAAKERLQKIDNNVNKLVDMVNTLLDISRIESKRIEINIAPGDIAKLIQDVADLLMPQTESENIKLSTRIPSTLSVLMDKNLIERVLINLINNAIKFTPQGGEIMIRCEVKNKRAIISVSDTGLGIPKHDLENIFQEFFRVDDPKHKEVKGSGLGLSLVKRIIETHKETIWVASEVHKGTTFHFTLKLAEDV